MVRAPFLHHFLQRMASKPIIYPLRQLSTVIRYLFSLSFSFRLTFAKAERALEGGLCIDMYMVCSDHVALRYLFSGLHLRHTKESQLNEIPCYYNWRKHSVVPQRR